MVTELITKRDLTRARELVESAHLSFETNYDNLVGIYEGRQLVAVGARAHNILKMLVVHPDHQGGALLGELVTELVRLGYRDGGESLFVFTAPANAGTFQALNFNPLVNHPKVTLLEYGQGIQHYLKAHGDLVRKGNNGAVVVNCNPFTLGHRYLIEEAASKVDTLYVFVVREDRSAFPFDVRMRLVREGTANLENLVVLDSSHYAVSGITFPAYFLKAEDPVSQIQMEVDLALFGKYLAPFFGIRRRFIGTEPYCRTTRLYSETMKRVLPGYGIETVQVERRRVGEGVISAYRVREAIRNEAFETLRRLVPGTTLDYIRSEQARSVCEQLKNTQRRH